MENENLGSVIVSQMPCGLCCSAVRSVHVVGSSSCDLELVLGGVEVVPVDDQDLLLGPPG